MTRLWRFFCITLASIFIFSSCQKKIYAVKNHDEVMGTPLPTTGMYCRIESIWENPGTFDQRFWLVAYDEFENPGNIVTVTRATLATEYTYNFFSL